MVDQTIYVITQLITQEDNKMEILSKKEKWSTSEGIPFFPENLCLICAICISTGWTGKFD